MSGLSFSGTGLSLTTVFASNIAGGLANQILYQTAPSTTGFITAPSVTNSFLRWTGAAFDWSTSATTLTIGTTTITGGTTTRILYDNAGALGEYTLTGTGTVVAMQTSPSLVTPALGVATGTSLALGGATLGTYVLAAVGSAALTGATTTSPDWEVWVSGDTFARASLGVNSTDVPRFSMGPGNAARDVFIERAGAANKRSGAPDAAAPVAQMDSVQNVVAGTTNTAGANRTFAGSQGTGTGVGGSLIFQIAPAGSTGTSQNALATALTIDSTKLLTAPGAISIGGASILTNVLAVTGTVRFNTGAANPTLFGQHNPSTTINALSLNGDLTDAGNSGLFSESNGILYAQGQGHMRIRVSNTTVADFGGSTSSLNGSLSTAAPAGSSAGAWKFGALQAGAVVLDTTRSIFVDIGGTVYKLMVAA